MIVYLPEQNNISYDLKPDTRIESIAYEEPSKYTNSESSAETWKGFGIY
jgi:hypothetical protein